MPDHKALQDPPSCNVAKATELMACLDRLLPSVSTTLYLFGHPSVCQSAVHLPLLSFIILSPYPTSHPSIYPFIWLFACICVFLHLTFNLAECRGFGEGLGFLLRAIFLLAAGAFLTHIYVVLFTWSPLDFQPGRIPTMPASLHSRVDTLTLLTTAHVFEKLGPLLVSMINTGG